MPTPQEIRDIRIKNELKALERIKCDIINWQPVDPNQIILRVKVKAVISPQPEYRHYHEISVILPPGYPTTSPPTIRMLTTPYVYHPNWYDNGHWCYGSWTFGESLPAHILRMIRTLQYDLDITNPNSAANPEANEWFQENPHLFPCDHQILPDPTGSLPIKKKPLVVKLKSPS